MQQWVPTVLGYVLPVSIVIGGLAALENVPVRSDPSFRDAIVGDLAVDQPAVVVIGNSLTAAGIEEEILETQLGAEVSVVTVPGSEAPAWYALVENTILGTGHDPAAIVIVNRMDGLLSVTARTQQDLQRLDQLMVDNEPVLDRKVLFRDTRNPRWSRLMQRRRDVTRTFLDSLRDVTSRVLVSDPASVVRSQSRVFADDKVDYGLYTNPMSASDVSALAAPADSLVPDLVALARDHGTKLVFVHIPSAPGTPDLVDGDTQRELLALLNDAGAGFVDRPEQLANATWFQDPVHLNAQGRKRYSAFLGKRLAELGLTDPATALPSAVLPYRAPTVARTGPLPAPVPVVGLSPVDGTCTWEASSDVAAALVGAGAARDLTSGRLVATGLPPAWPIRVFQGDRELSPRVRPWQLSRDCEPGTYAVAGNRVVVVPDGKGRVTLGLAADPTIAADDKGLVSWVYPGSTVTVSSTEPWDPQWGPLTVDLLAMPFGDGAGEPTMRIDGSEATLRGAGIRRARLTGQAGDWTVEIHSPADGPYLAIHTLEVGEGPHRTSFLGGGRTGERLTMDVIGRHHTATRAAYAADPPALVDVSEPTFDAQGLGLFVLPSVAGISDDQTGRCSPVAVLEDGQPLSRHHKCREIATTPGSQCHSGSEIRFHPTSPGHTYSLVLDRTPNGTCDTEAWLLPGDTLEVVVRPDQLLRFLDGPQELALSAEVFRAERAETLIDVVLWSGDDELFRETVGAASLARGLTVPLDRRLPRNVPATLTLHNPSSASLLLQKATLVEPIVTPVATVAEATR